MKMIPAKGLLFLISNCLDFLSGIKYSPVCRHCTTHLCVVYLSAAAACFPWTAVATVHRQLSAVLCNLTSNLSVLCTTRTVADMFILVHPRRRFTTYLLPMLYLVVHIASQHMEHKLVRQGKHCNSTVVNFYHSQTELQQHGVGIKRGGAGVDCDCDFAVSATNMKQRPVRGGQVVTTGTRQQREQPLLNNGIRGWRNINRRYSTTMTIIYGVSDGNVASPSSRQPYQQPLCSPRPLCPRGGSRYGSTNYC